MKMRVRCLGVVILLLLVTSTLVTPARAQTAPPTNVPSSTVTVPDLAAMTLIPSDLPQPGFGRFDETFVTLNEAARGLAHYLGGEAAAYRERLSSDGYETRYASQLGLPQQLGAAQPRMERRVTSSVTLYRTAQGARAAFALSENVSTVPTARVIRGTRTIGDQSQLTQDHGPAFQELDLTFRLGSLLGEVTVGDYSGQAPSVATLEGLATTLQQHIRRVLAAGDGLGRAVLRLQDTGVPPVTLYDRLAGQTIPHYNETAADVATRTRAYGGAVDVYLYDQVIPRGQPVGTLPNGGPEYPPETPEYVVRLFRFPSDQAAAAWLHATPQRLAREPGNYVDLQTMPSATHYGDESLTLAYGLKQNETVTTRGYRIYVRVGAEVGWLQLDALPAVPLAAVQTLMSAQVACLRAGICPRPAGIPPALLVPPSVGTPAAGTAPAEATSSMPAGTPPVAMPTSSPSAGGGQYQSPSWGYAVQWDASWRAQSSTSHNQQDTLVLVRDGATAYLTGYASQGTPQDCVQATLAGYRSNPNLYQHLTVAKDAKGQPVQGARGRGAAQGDEAFVAFDATYAPPGGAAAPYGYYVDCVRVQSQPVVFLQMVLIVPGHYDPTSSVVKSFMAIRDSLSVPS